MGISRTFSIYLLKETYNSDNALKTENKLGNPTNAINLPQNSVLYLKDSSPSIPWWKDYWGIEKNVSQVLEGALVFVPIDGHCFVLTFGHTNHNLKESSYEYDFGIRVTLNSIDPKKLRSTDILIPDNAKRERIQSPIGSNLEYFNLDKDSSIMKNLAGKVKDEYADYFSNVSGGSSLRISTKVKPNDLIVLLRKLYEIYIKDDYENIFPEINSIKPIKDPSIIDKLNNKLVQAFEEKASELVLTIPEIVQFQDDFTISFSGLGMKSNLDTDIDIENYREYLSSAEKETITLEDLKNHKVNMYKNDGEEIKSFSIYKCILFDCKFNNFHYHICESNWYQFENDYISKMQSDLDKYFYTDSMLRDYKHKSEADYNTKIAEGNEEFICLDRKNVSSTGQVEPCDLYSIDNDTARLYHIKRNTKSATLSHLFNQGMNSIQLIRVDEKAKAKLVNLIEENISNSNKDKFINPIEEENFEVIYGIITTKDPEKKSLNLPIFSRISLKRSITTLKLMRIKVQICFIRDFSLKKKK